MEKLESNNGRRKYRETVSFKCPDPQVLKLVVDLDFVITDQSPQSASAEYRLSHVEAGDPRPRQRAILEVLQLGPEEDSRVRVKTTKKISFSHDIGGPGMANILCLLGYLGMVEDLLWCASGHTGTSRACSRHPRRLAQGWEGLPRHLSARKPERAASTRLPGPREGDDRAARRCDREVHRRICRGSQGVLHEDGQGKYKADDWVADMAKAWVRMLGDASTIADLGLRSPRGPQSGRPRSGASMEL